MRTTWLRPVLEREGPFVSVCLDASRDDAAGAHQLDLRWASHQQSLVAAGAPRSAVAAAGEAAVSPTGRAGRLGHLVVADANGVALDVVLPEPPAREVSSWAPVPQLLPLFRGTAAGVVHAVVDVDRKGADIEVVGVLGEALDAEQVEGDHDVLHKVQGGRMSQRRYHARVEDSWDHNAASVARSLEAVVRRHRPELVVLRGDDKALAALSAQLGKEVRERAVRVAGGGRAAGSERAATEQVRKVVAEHSARVRADVLDRFRQGEGRQDTAVQGLSDVLDALRRSQVDELLLCDDPSSTLRLWVGRTPGAVAQTRRELAALGEQEPQEVAAGTALVWAAVSTDAGVTLLELPESAAAAALEGAAAPADQSDSVDGRHKGIGLGDLVDGVAALLRWSDASTPHDGAPSMPGHGDRR